MIRSAVPAIVFAAFVFCLSAVSEAGSKLSVPPPPGVLSPNQPWLLQMAPGKAKPKATQSSSRSTRVVSRRSNGLFIFKQSRKSQKPRQQPRGIAPQFLPQVVRYDGGQAPGTIIIDTNARLLYLVLEDGKAQRYGVGVGRPGFEWAGTHTITRKAEWPAWTPPPEMIAREAERGRILPASMEGGPRNPLGARALYLGDTLYRIHGSNEPWTIGHAVSSGCIRMRNEDVMDLYARVEVGTKVLVR